MSAMIGNPFFIDVSRGGRLAGEGYGAPFGLAFSRPSLATMFDTSGRLTFCPNNLLLNTATLSTQSVTLAAGNYILSIKGSGSVTLSGSASGTLAGTGANNRVDLAFSVATSGSVTCTVSGSVTNARLSRVTFETSFRTMDDVETTGSSYYGPRFGAPKPGGVPGLIIEPSRTNSIGSNIFLGGVAGSPGTAPTGWSLTTGGLTRTLSFGTINGMPYMAARYAGTPGGTTAFVISVSLGAISSIGQTWANSAFIMLSAGALTNTENWTLRASSEAGGTVFTPSGTLTRVENVRTLASSGDPSLNLRWNHFDTVTPVDYTILIACPQTELGSSATSPLLTSGSAVARSADALSFNVPSFVSSLRYTFDDKSTQDVSVSTGAYTVPTNLNRARLRHIKRVA